MILLYMMILIFVITGIGDILTIKREKDFEDFTGKRQSIKAPLILSVLGVIDVLFAMGLSALMYVSGDPFVVRFCLGFLLYLPGFLLMASPVYGVWEVRIEDETITVLRCFWFQKEYTYSDIIRCVQTRSGFRIYAKDRKRKAFFVDRLMYGTFWFIEEMKERNVPIEYLDEKKTA